MTYIRNHRWLALLACIAMLSLVFGCHGPSAEDYILSFFKGSWKGDAVDLFAFTMVLAFVMANTVLQVGDDSADGSAVGTTQVGDPAQLWANVEGEGPIHYVGTVAQDGNKLVVNLAPGPDEPQTGFTMTLELDGDSAKQELTGDLTWSRDGEDFTGDANFERYPE